MRKFYPLLVFLLLPFLNYGQYDLNGDAVSAATCGPNYSGFKLTPNELYKVGSVFKTTQVNLNQNFEINAKLNFGAFDGGADGMAFVLQAEGTGYIGNWGAGLGYHRFNGPPPMPVDNPGPVPSFIVEFDTWENGDIFGMNVGDPAADHVGFMSNSNAYHTSPTTLKAPEVLSSNIEDGQYHDVRFTWNATTKTMTVRFVTQNLPEVVQTFTYTGDIVNTIFGGNPLVYFGFTGSTGSVIPNEHHVCILNDIPPPPPPSCGQLRTQTPGGWGAKPAGNNPGAYLHANFAAAFPTGLTIGSTPDYNALFTSAQAITNFLPSGGQAKALTQNYTNPTGLKNTLAGHLVALSLSVRFDMTDPNFGPAGVNLGNMIIGSGAFSGWTVNDFLAEANKVLGGTSTLYSVQDALSTATAINENYSDGNTNNNYLNCPSSTPPSVSARVIMGEAAAIAQVRALPNPSSGNFNLQFTTDPGKNAQVYIISSNGSIIEKRELNGGKHSINFDLNDQPSGLYFVRIITEAGEQVKKMVIQK
jgi:hypothetical protein